MALAMSMVWLGALAQDLWRSLSFSLQSQCSRPVLHFVYKFGVDLGFRLWFRGSCSGLASGLGLIQAQAVRLWLFFLGSSLGLGLGFVWVWNWLRFWVSRQDLVQDWFGFTHWPFSWFGGVLLFRIFGAAFIFFENAWV